MEDIDNNDNKQCCPRFDPTPWDEKEFTWQDKSFIKDSVKTLWFMPLNFGSVMTRLSKKVRDSGADCPDFICLAEHTSKWRMDLYLSVNKEIENAENITLSGKYFSKVYEGPFKEAGNWHKKFITDVKTKGHELIKTYYWYTTCPKCAKKYGKNYVVLIAQIG